MYHCEYKATAYVFIYLYTSWANQEYENNRPAIAPPLLQATQDFGVRRTDHGTVVYTPVLDNLDSKSMSLSYAKIILIERKSKHFFNENFTIISR